MATELDHLKPPTEMQEVFLRVFVETGDATRAATEAGYANPEAQGRQLRRNINLAPLIRQETHRRLQSYVPTAISTIVDAMNDEKAPRAVRLDAAKTILDRAGYVVPTNKQHGSEVRPFAELSLAELQEVASKLRDEMGRVASNCIDITPDKTAVLDGNSPQALDMLD